MLDRSDLLWRDDDPTPATTPARDDHAKDDQARQVTPAPRPTSRRGMVKTGRRNPPATTSRGLSRNPPARASIRSGPRSSAPTTRRTKPGLPASARNARPSGRARMRGIARMTLPARTRATPARTTDDPRARTGRARSGPATARSPTHRHAPPAIGGNTTPARTTPRRATGRAAAGPNARAMRWPTWGSIAPCPTQTCPTNILTATPTPPGAASIT